LSERQGSAQKLHVWSCDVRFKAASNDFYYYHKRRPSLGFVLLQQHADPNRKGKNVPCDLSTQVQVIDSSLEPLRFGPTIAEPWHDLFALHNGSCPQLSSLYELKTIRTMCKFYIVIQYMKAPPPPTFKVPHVSSTLRFRCSTSKAPQLAHSEFVCRSRSRIFGVGIVISMCPASFLMRRGNIYICLGPRTPIMSDHCLSRSPTRPTCKNSSNCIMLTPKQRMNGAKQTTTWNMAFNVMDMVSYATRVTFRMPRFLMNK
jgi:hypothetical protein